jgi:L-asparaginase II
MTTAAPSSNPVLVQAWRGRIVESVHRGSVAVVDAAGRVVASLGDIERPVFPRSAIKVLQALPLVASGAAEALALTDEELALACASHGGEPRHAAGAASMLAKAGLDVAALECGTHWPYHEASARALAAAGKVASALHNNCSGKHAGFLCLACRMADGRDVRALATGYVQPSHPVMREVTAAVAAATGFDLARAERGTDGCSIPTYAVPLRHLALGFARVASGQGLAPGHAAAAKRLRQAVAAAPFMVGGSGTLDTRLMEHFGERVFSKVGAEGMYCAALPELGLGIAIKADDGNTARACEVMLAATLHALLPLSEADSRFLRRLLDRPLVNWNAIEVGRLAATEAFAAIGRAAKH